MKKLIAFWNKDLVNKLISLTVAGLVVAVIIFAVVVLRLPEDKSLRGAALSYLPKSLETKGPTSTPSLTPYPEWTPRPTRTLTPTLPVQDSETPTPTGVAAAQTPLPTMTVTPSPMPTMASSNPTAVACIPSAAAQKATVLEIVDGATVKVLMDDKVYVVRYLGLNPLDPLSPFYMASTAKNSELVYAKQVQLIADATDKDASGRLLRYVFQGDTFINLELLNQGLAGLGVPPPDYACAALFAQAEKTAQQNKAGQWSLAPTP